ncbi:MAG: undecaprenyl/decaprenyl-phosphate alpha-N-acetylglucosaminyl 1-phosphate transferase [Bacteroidota bacterium]|nr:undecaprenyl/decaprenyl-phosphate alpha-N-acetylglucosaminyl 1-phosphate transferase [Bacteroidota bacterium]
MENILLSGGLAFIITFFSIPVIIEVAINKGLFDEPDERKIHNGVVPTLGGLGIFAGFIVASLLGVPSSVPPVFQYFVAAIMVIFFLGIKDDIIILSATKKFIGQLIAAGIIIKFGGIQIANMNGFLGLYAIPPSASFLLTLFTIVVITNSFNLIDGIDGLAGSLGLMTSTVFGLYFTLTGQYMYAVMAFSLVGSLVAFLIYNFAPAKIFMGDTGSLLIGLLNSIFVIKFIAVASNPSLGFPIEAAPAVAFSILIVPLFDTLRVVTIRIVNRRSPFCPDRNHIHHLLLGLGFSHTQISMTCLSTNVLFIGLAYYLRDMGTTIDIFALSGVALLLAGIVYYNRAKIRRLRKPVISHRDTVLKSHNIFSLTGEPMEQN